MIEMPPVSLMSCLLRQFLLQNNIFFILLWYSLKKKYFCTNLFKNIDVRIYHHCTCL